MEKKNLAIVGGLGALAAYLYYTRRPCELCETCETSCEFSCQTCEISQDVPDHCGRDNPDWKHDDQIYDVTSIMNSQGYSGYWELDVTMHNGPSIISIYGPEEPPERSDKEKVQSWLSGFDLHRGFCYIDNNYYWLKYPASLTHTPYPPCLTCEVACESSCMESCEVHCQTGCEVSCEADCETACQAGCEISVEPPSPPEKRKLSVHAEEGGTTDPSPGTYYYDPLDVVRVLAIPNSGYIFDHWSLGGSKFYPNPIDVLMDADINLIAYFKEAPSPPCGTEDIPTPPPPEPGTGHVLVTSLEVESVPATTEGGCNTLHYEAVLTNPGSESATHHVEIYLEYGGTSSSIYSQDVTLEPAQTKYLANNIRMCLSGTLTVGMSVTIRVVAENEKSASVVLYPGPTPPPCTTQCEICETPFEICGVIETCGTLETCPTDVCRVSCEIPSEISPPSGIEVWVFSAEWCEGCPVAKAWASKVANEYGVGYRVIDVDANPDLASQYNATTLPTIIVLIEGSEVCRVLTESALRSCLDQYVTPPGEVFVEIEGLRISVPDMSSRIEECYFYPVPSYAGESFRFVAYLNTEFSASREFVAEAGEHTITARLMRGDTVLDTCSKTYSIEAPPLEECTIDDDVWKHGDEVYDVTEVMNRNGYGGTWELSVTMHNGPTKIQKYGPNEPPEREDAQMIQSWQSGFDLHRGFCPKDNNYYWLTYPAVLTQTSEPSPGRIEFSSFRVDPVGWSGDPNSQAMNYKISAEVKNVGGDTKAMNVVLWWNSESPKLSYHEVPKSVTLAPGASTFLSQSFSIPELCPGYPEPCYFTIQVGGVADNSVSTTINTRHNTCPTDVDFCPVQFETGGPPCYTCDVSVEECEACEITCQTGCEVSCEASCEVACQRSDDEFRHGDEEYDVTSTMNSQGYGGSWILSVIMHNGPKSISLYGPTEPPDRTASEMVSGWRAGYDMHRAYCSKNGMYYWVKYPATLTQTSPPCGTCDTACQTGCEVSCQYGCEVSCEETCETSCQYGCEISCETGCMVSCQSSCQVACQTSCEVACQSGCEVSCQYVCESLCQVGCELACEGECETACMTPYELCGIVEVCGSSEW